MTATIYDVAKKAGVSTATVSKALSNTPYVSQATRARIMAAVEELQYVPSLAARGLSKARTFILALIIPYTSDYLYSDPHLLELMRGIEQESQAHRYSVLLSTGGGDMTTALQAGRGHTLSNSYVDGVILVAASILGASLAELNLQGRPCVSVGYHAPPGLGVTVHADDQQGAAAATQHLLAWGHRRIGVISAIQPITALTQRFEGFGQALAAAGVGVEPALLARGDFSPESGYAAAGQLMAQTPRPTAIFAFNDRMAMGAIRKLRDLGLAVPGDVAVVGFDDIPEAALFDPALTTVRQPALQMGATATRLLLGLIEDGAQQRSEVVLPAELVVRASCGAALAAVQSGRSDPATKEAPVSLPA